MTPQLIPLTCPSCSGQMEVQQGVAELTCPYCGTTFVAPALADSETLNEIAEKTGEVATLSQRLAWVSELDRCERHAELLRQQAQRIAAVRGKGAMGVGAVTAVLFLPFAGIGGAILGFFAGMVLYYLYGAYRLGQVHAVRKRQDRRAAELQRLLGEEPAYSH